jgi:hypothetical protein
MTRKMEEVLDKAIKEEYNISDTPIHLSMSVREVLGGHHLKKGGEAQRRQTMVSKKL